MAIAAGFPYTCSTAAVGGISAVYLANEADFTTVTVASGVVTVLTFASTKHWWQVGAEDDGISFTEETVVQNGRVLYKPEYKIKLGARSATAKAFLMSLSGCERFLVAHVERTGVTWVSGYTATQALRIIGGTSQTGNTVADENMIEITIGHPIGVQYPAATTALSIATS